MADPLQYDSESSTDSDDHRRLSRRRILAGGAGLAAGGVAYLTVGVQPGDATARVSAGAFTVADGQYSTPGGDVWSPLLVIDAVYEYSGCEQAAQAVVTVSVDGAEAARHVDGDIAAPSGRGTPSLRVPVVAADTWTSSDWTAPAGGDVSHTVDVTLGVEIWASGGSVLARGSVSDTTTITVTNSGPERTATIGGSGSVEFAEAETN